MRALVVANCLEHLPEWRVHHAPDEKVLHHEGGEYQVVKHDVGLSEHAEQTAARYALQAILTSGEGPPGTAKKISCARASVIMAK